MRNCMSEIAVEPRMAFHVPLPVGHLLIWMLVTYKPRKGSTQYRFCREWIVIVR